MGMLCEKCGNETNVIDSRRGSLQYKAANGLIRRRRDCQNCGHRFTTLEIPEFVMKQMVTAQARLQLLEDALRGTTNFEKTPKLRTVASALEHYSKRGL